jgi:Ca-activated chloride channel family protein
VWYYPPHTACGGLFVVPMPNYFASSRLLVVLCGTLLFTPRAASQSTDQVPNLPGIPIEAARSIADSFSESQAGLSHVKALRVDVDLVLVPVTVTDPMNHPVLGLRKQDFKVYENNDPQQIQYFSAEEAPISVGVLLDVSKSMTNKFVTERAAAEAFFKNANPQDDFFVITFADQPRLVTSSIDSLDDIQQNLASDIPDGHTALLDAIYLAIARMRSARYQRRALLIVTDGADNHSRYGLKEVRRLVEEASVDVYAIGIFDSLFFRSFEEMMGKRWLREITDVTGGRTVAAAGLEKVPEIAADVSREMRNQYVLGYRPSNNARDSKWRKIKVNIIQAAGKARVQTRYKKGYVAAAR